ncbi:zinc-binding alcohol dehydrogenase [Chloroflexota bacterium]
MMKRKSLYFTAARQVEVREEELPKLGKGEVLVETRLSVISPGTELLLYRDQAPAEMDADATIASLGGTLAYPLKYGYAAVGEVVKVGSGVEKDWRGRMVFVFNPHESQFVAGADSLIPLPENMALEDAVFLPLMETAVNFIMDGLPMMGEKVAVFGQGIVGLLTTALLSFYPLASLVTFDHFDLRRKASLSIGAHLSLDPSGNNTPALAKWQEVYQGADLVFELSGQPEALDQAIDLAGFNGRVVIGSWYGTKQASLNLGGDFHRKRIKLSSSQVSTLTPELSGRWSKARRFQVAWEMLGQVKPERFITHEFPIDKAAEAYRLLDQEPDKAIQVVFKY